LFINVVSNASSAKIDGLELSLDSRFGPIDLRLSADLLRAQYANFLNCSSPATCALPSAQLKGQDLPNAPRTKLGGSITYHLPVDPALGNMSVNVNGNWQSTYRTQDYNAPQVILGNFGIMNVGARWDHVSGRPIFLEAFVTNALDAKNAYGSLPYYLLLGQSAVTYLEPRMYGVRVRYEFGQ
jgi:iron complex outermembrane receptor protein